MHKERLLKLAEHLESGKLGHKEFDMSTWNSANGPECGTSGCAVGECPIIWPEDWKFGPHGHPTVRAYSVYASAQIWFGLTITECYDLFMPDSYPQNHITPKVVAARIRSFVAQKESEDLKEGRIGSALSLNQ